MLAVLGPDAILGYELARQLGARAIFADGPLGGRTLRPRFRVKVGERVLILMVAVLVDRSSVPLQLGVTVEPLAVFDLEAYRAPVCPVCSEGQPLERRLE